MKSSINQYLSSNPLKIQARSITNHGSDYLFIFSVDDDMPIVGSSLLAFCQIRLVPGHTIDLSNHPHIHTTEFYSPDKDICLFSHQDIVIEVESDHFYDQWKGDASHPWNGAPLPNGQYTVGWTPKGNKIQRPALPAASKIPLSTLLTPPVGFWGNPVPTEANVSIEQHYGDESPVQKECICVTRVLMNNGCICGHVKRKQWGLR